MQILNFNTIIFGLTIALIGFGLLFGENRVRVISMGAVLALFTLGQVPAQYLAETTQKGFFGLHPSAVQVQFILLGVIVALFAFGSVIGVHKAENKGRSVIMSILTALLLVCFGMAMLPSSDRATLMTNYNLAAIAYAIRFYVLLALTLWLIITQFKPAAEKKK